MVNNFHYISVLLNMLYGMELENQDLEELTRGLNELNQTYDFHHTDGFQLGEDVSYKYEYENEYEYDQGYSIDYDDDFGLGM